MAEKLTFKIAATPQQRFWLLNLIRDPSQKVKGQRSRELRRFMRALKLDVIDLALAEHEGFVNPKQSSNRTPALFEMTAADRDYAVSIYDTIERAPEIDSLLGSFWDAIDDSKRDDYQAAEVPDYDAAAEDWGGIALKERGSMVERVIKIMRVLPKEQMEDLADEADKLLRQVLPAMVPNGSVIKVAAPVGS